MTGFCYDFNAQLDLEQIVVLLNQIASHYSITPKNKTFHYKKKILKIKQALQQKEKTSDYSDSFCLHTDIYTFGRSFYPKVYALPIHAFPRNRTHDFDV